MVEPFELPCDDPPFSFSRALDHLKFGASTDDREYSIQRDGWNGKGLHVKMQVPDANSKMTLPYLYIEYPDGKRCPWLASQTDILSEDWQLFIHERE